MHVDIARHFERSNFLVGGGGEGWHYVVGNEKQNNQAKTVLSLDTSMTCLCHSGPASTRIRILLNPQLFLCGFGFRPDVSSESSKRIRNFLNPLSRMDIFEHAVNPESCAVSIKERLRTADYGLRTGYKIQTRFKTRTGKYGLGIKHRLGKKRGLQTADWV